MDASLSPNSRSIWGIHDGISLLAMTRENYNMDRLKITNESECHTHCPQSSISHFHATQQHQRKPQSVAIPILTIPYAHA